MVFVPFLLTTFLFVNVNTIKNFQILIGFLIVPIKTTFLLIFYFSIFMQNTYQKLKNLTKITEPWDFPRSFLRVKT